MLALAALYVAFRPEEGASEREREAQALVRWTLLAGVVLGIVRGTSEPDGWLWSAVGITVALACLIGLGAFALARARR